MFYKSVHCARTFLSMVSNHLFRLIVPTMPQSCFFLAHLIVCLDVCRNFAVQSISNEAMCQVILRPAFAGHARKATDALLLSFIQS